MAASTAEPNFEEVADTLDLKPGQVRQAWEQRERITEMISDGLPVGGVGGISSRVNAPKRAVQWVVDKLGHAAPTPEAPAETRSEEERTPTPEEPHENVDPIGQPSRPPLPAPAPGAGAPPLEMQFMGGADLSGDIRAIPPRDFGGKYEVPDMYAALYNLCTAFGMNREQAGGLVWTFQAQYPPNNTDGLRELLASAGKNEVVIRQILNGWAGVLKRAGVDESTGSPRDTRATLEAIQKDLGMRTGQGGRDPLTMSIEDLQKTKMQIEIEKTRAEMEEQRRQLRERTGGSPTGGTVGDDDTQEIMLLINGVPTMRRIRTRDLPMYQPFLARPGGERSTSETEPEWVKAMREENRALRERLDRQDREREEERRRRDQEELVMRATAPLREEIQNLKQAMAGNPQQTELERKYDALVEEVRRKSNDQLMERLERMESSLNSANDPDRAIRVIQAERARAARLGMVSAEERARLEAEQVALEAERDAARTKNSAQADLFKTGMERLKDKPIQSMAREAGLPELVGEALKDRVRSQERPGRLREPTDEEILRAAKEMEAAERTPPPAEGGE